MNTRHRYSVIAIMLAIAIVVQPLAPIAYMQSTDTHGVYLPLVSSQANTQITVSPTIQLLPTDLSSTMAQSVVIRWFDDDPDSDARISLYYDTDNTGDDGILIDGNQSEEDETDSYLWNTIWVDDGEYYIYALIEDDENDPVIAYSAAPITIAHSPETEAFVTDASALAIGSTSIAGWTEGEFDVDAVGAATYAIPLVVSPGTNNMQPKLSFAYSSGTGNGLLGIGWSLEGLSAISRCPTTKAQDGLIDPVDFDSNDRFCISGQKLVAITGAYGADGTEYRTETDAFFKVISYGVAGGGPERFVVWNRAGNILDYGATTDSRIEAQGRADVLTWGVNRISDRFGNHLTVSYTEDTANGESYPSRIDYTANSAAALTPRHSVQMTYEPRPDVIVQYIGGSLVKTTQRLKTVAAYRDVIKVREYQLTYDRGSSTGRSRLTQVVECGLNNQCFAPTTFTWQDRTGPVAFQTVQYPVTYAGGYIGAGGDFNGDGLLDLMTYEAVGYRAWDAGTQLKHDHQQVYLGNGNGSFKTNPYLLGTYNSGYIAVNGDFNGDGKTDLFSYEAYGGARPLQWIGSQPIRQERMLSRLSQGNGNFTAVQYTLGAFDDGLVAASGDLNGDGLTDFITYKADQYHRWLWTGPADEQFMQLHLARGDGGFDKQQYTLGAHQEGLVGTAGDFNGDGLTDLITYEAHSYGRWRAETPAVRQNMQVHLNNGNGAFTKQPYLLGDYLEGVIGNAGDYNGDGLTDFITYQSPSGRGWVGSTPANQATMLVHLSKGNGDFVKVPYVLGDYDEGIIAGSGDFNGDGLTDLITYFAYPDGRWRGLDASYYAKMQIHIAKGDGTFDKYQYTLGNYSDGRIAVIGDVNGDNLTDFMTYDADNYGRWRNSANSLMSHIAGGAMPDVLTGITNGIGAQITVAYAPLTDPAIYGKGNQALYPKIDLQTPAYVVKNYRTSDGIGGAYQMSYRYNEAVVDMTGRGFLGFKQVEAIDEQTGIRSVASYLQDFPFTNQLQQTETRLANGTVIERSTNQWRELPSSFSGIRYPFIAQNNTESYELNGSLTLSVTTTYQYDSFGNLLQSVETTSDGFAKTTVATYVNDVNRWLLGQATRIQTTRQAPNQPALTRTVAFTYNPDTAQVSKEELEPTDPLWRLTTRYRYDLFGNQTSVTIGGAGITPENERTTTFFYDAEGRLLLRTRNALGHLATNSYDANFGVLTRYRDPNGLNVTYAYDVFGRQIKETRPDGSTSQLQYLRCSATTQCPANAVYFVLNQSTSLAPTLAYFDNLKRKIRAETTGFNGQPIYNDVIYNNRGEVLRASRSYAATEQPQYTEYTYDLRGRVLTQTEAGNRVTQALYQGFTVAVTNPKGQVATRIHNSQEQLLTSTDAANQSVTYSYDSFGNPLTVTDPAGNRTTISYNLRGMKLAINDPDTRTTTYQYNTFGELLTQVDAKNQQVTLAYDKVGRVTTRLEPEGTTTWLYDVGNRAIGQLATVSRSDGYQENNSYDNLGRLATQTTLINGQSYTIAKTYDRLSRVLNTVYPTGFTVRNGYNDKGDLTTVRRTDTNRLFWQATSINARGQIEVNRLGNNLQTRYTYDAATGWLADLQVGTTANPTTIQNFAFTFDPLGNLTSRTDRRQNLSETFAYDNLNRLLQSQVSGQAAKSYSYDALGNITAKSDVGAYLYGQNGAGPHAVTQAGSTSYSYDANGNRTTSSVNGVTDNIAYSSFNKPLQMQKGSTLVNYTYGPDRETTTKTVSQSGGLTTTVYIGGLFEVTTGISTTQKIHYIMAGGETIATYNEINGSGVTSYLHKDHLGSLTTVTDQSGRVRERLSYDAWGKRRGSNWQDVDPSTITSSINRSFTGHEPIDAVGLIHMGGRVYDPVIGRFLSADPFVQEPANLQSLNRYSYVLNNPLSYTDPSGYFFNKLFKAIGHAFKAVFKAIKKVAHLIAAAVVGAALIFITQGGATPLVIAAAGAVTSVGTGAAIRGRFRWKDAVFDAIGGALASLYGAQIAKRFLSQTKLITNQGTSSPNSGNTKIGSSNSSGLGSTKNAEFEYIDKTKISATANTFKIIARTTSEFTGYTTSNASNNSLIVLTVSATVLSKTTSLSSNSKCQCSNIPMAPLGVDVDANIKLAQSKRMSLKTGSAFWFKYMVDYGREWDYKQIDSIYEDFGNFNYGATGRSLGFSPYTLYSEAGRAQIGHGSSRPEWGSPGSRWNPFDRGSGTFGDQPKDKYWNEQGQQYYDCGCYNH